MAWDMKWPRPSGGYSVDSSAKQVGAERYPETGGGLWSTTRTAARIIRDLGKLPDWTTGRRFGDLRPGEAKHEQLSARSSY
jgi:hypothetical protein